MVVDKEEVIRPLDASYYSLHVLSYPLVEAAHLIGVGRGTSGGVLGVFTEFLILHELARLFNEYWKIHGIGAGCVCPGTVSNGRIWCLWSCWRRAEDGA